MTRRGSQPDEAQYWAAIHHWYATAQGEAVRTVEQQQLDQALPRLFGYRLVQVGRTVQDDLCRQSPIRTRHLCSPLPGGDLVGRGAALPLASDSIDLVLLHHSLEFMDDPHAVLREAERVLIAEGHLVVVGFNPWSLSTLLERIARRPAPVTRVGLNRLADWVRLLGFEVRTARHFHLPPPCRWLPGGERWRAWLARRCPWLGGGYILVARKRVLALTPLRQRWRAPQTLLPGLARPTTRLQNREVER